MPKIRLTEAAIAQLEPSAKKLEYSDDKMPGLLLRHNPDLPVHRLPVSWRLPHSAASVVAEAFYPFTGFRSGTGPGERTLTFGSPAAALGSGGAALGSGGATLGSGGAAFGSGGATFGSGGATLGSRAAGALDEVLDAAAATGWGLHELPARFTVRTDAEAAGACAQLAARALARGASKITWSTRTTSP